MYTMGTYYEKGVLDEVDIRKTKEYNILSADRENQDCMAALNRLLSCDNELKDENTTSMGLIN